MRWITIGTSHGYSEIGRATSGHLLTVNGVHYVFDCGTHVESKMTNENLSAYDIRCVFITHMHEDHVGSLSCIAKKFIAYSKNVRVDMFLPEQAGIDAFKGWLTALHMEPKEDFISFHCVKEGFIYSDENIRVKAIRTDHLLGGKYPSFVYYIEAEGKKLMYICDLSCDFHDYPQIVFEEDFDAIICELVHYDVEKNIDTIAKTRTKKMIYTHIFPTNYEQMQKNKDKLPFETVFAEDGMKFEI
ncbi:MAG: ribonuclease Z [Clostridia bacterium]|nr:ribonuclease Z [Clostridia bacterium]